MHPGFYQKYLESKTNELSIYKDDDLEKLSNAYVDYLKKLFPLLTNHWVSHDIEKYVEDKLKDNNDILGLKISIKNPNEMELDIITNDNDKYKLKVTKNGRSITIDLIFKDVVTQKGLGNIFNKKGKIGDYFVKIIDDLEWMVYDKIISVGKMIINLGYKILLSNDKYGLFIPLSDDRLIVVHNRGSDFKYSKVNGFFMEERYFTKKYIVNDVDQHFKNRHSSVKLIYNNNEEMILSTEDGKHIYTDRSLAYMLYYSLSKDTDKKYVLIHPIKGESSRVFIEEYGNQNDIIRGITNVLGNNTMFFICLKKGSKGRKILSFLTSIVNSKTLCNI